MSYEKQNWKNGDVITESKLNHMEDGIATGGGVLVVDTTFDEQTEVTTLGKTWQEIYDAPVAFLKDESNTGKNLVFVEAVYTFGGAYKIDAGTLTYSAESANDYPASQGGK
jgi:hypothetical protein